MEYKTPKVTEETKKFEIQIYDNKLDDKLFKYIEEVFKNTYYEKIYKGKMLIDVVDYVPNEYIPPAIFINNKGLIQLRKKVTCKFLSYEIGDVIEMYISFIDNRIHGINKYAECKNIEIKRDDIVIENGKYVFKNKKTGNIINFDSNTLVVIDKISSTHGSKKFILNVHFYEN
jgi:ribosomal protein L14